jgi:16S rRNA (cytidine1402-2'-O)-methyltransferase
MPENGKLYIIPTPIGNIEDITIRGKRILKELNHLACEDTRSTKKLLGLLDINYQSKNLYAHHEHNEAISVNGLIKILQNGDDIGLVSDAGTPLISDPGYKLLNLCRDIGIEIVSLPGASSVTSALAASGLPTDRFEFLGFVPQKKGRMTFINNLNNITHTSVFFESTHRIKKLFDSFCELGLKDRNVSVAKEISKLNEKHIRGTVGEVKAILETDNNLLKGEFVVVLSK